MSISSVRMNPSSVLAMVMSGRTLFVIPLAISGVVCVSGGSARGRNGRSRWCYDSGLRRSMYTSARVIG